MGRWVLRGPRETKDHRAQLALMGPLDNRVLKDLQDQVVLLDQQDHLVPLEPQELQEIRDHQDLLDRLVHQETVDLQGNRELQVNQAMLGHPDQLETKAIQVQRDR